MNSDGRWSDGSSPGELRWGGVDLDVLADYTAGVLDRAEAATVADLVATDSRWARVHSALILADVAVRDDLRAAAASTAEMPADVVARIEDALVVQARPEATVISLDAARARRRKIATTLTAAAAAVIAFVGGLSFVSTQYFSGQADSAAEAPAAAREDGGSAGGAPVLPPSSDLSLPRLVASGRDYSAETVGDLTPFAYPAPDPRAEGTKSASPFVAGEMASADGVLTRLTASAALEACLTAIRAVHPGVVRVVDYARYLGSPALVTLVQQGTSSIVVVVGPDCGTTGADLLSVITV